MVIAILLAAIILIFAKPTFASSALLNEFVPHPSSGDDWIEIYNPTSSIIDLNSWTLVDSTSTMKTLTGSVSPGSFVTFDVSNRLNNSGDSVYLKDSSGNTIDSHSYSSDPGTDKSLGRSPDGESWSTLISPSKGSANGSSSASTPSPTPTTSSTSSFTISDTPSQIDSDQSFFVKVSLNLPTTPNTILYLKGAFKLIGGSNYFGQTKVNSSWVKNNKSFSDQYKITTDSSGNWTGNLDVQPDILDSGYEGAGDYIFKVGKYTAEGSLTWSNEANIRINAQEIKLEENDESSILSSTHSSPSIPNIKQNVTKNSSTPTATIQPSTTPSPAIKGEKHTNWPMILGGILAVSGIGFMVYIIFKTRLQSLE